MLTPNTPAVDEQFAIVASGERPAAPLVLKHADTFGVFDQHGDVSGARGSEQGLYHRGTRYLSYLELLLDNEPLMRLSSTISRDNTTLTVDFTNPDLRGNRALAVPRGSVHLFRARVLADGSSIERIRVSNYAAQPIDLPLGLGFDADFADVFEVRGLERRRRGERLPAETGTACTLRYRGLDGVERRTRVEWDRKPDVIEAGRIAFALHLGAGETTTLEVRIVCEEGGETRRVPTFEEVLGSARTAVAGRTSRACRIVTSNEMFNRWIDRSTADLQMLLTETADGLYPYAGIPWFSTPFGRDGIITAFEMLWADPAIARGVLSFLAATQATARSDARDAQPGKILHEMRSGEMPALGEVPFGRYYGTVDATPLFVMLADAYFARSADAAFIDQVWPHVLAALEWMDTDGDLDGDGFIEYARRTGEGLVQQGWKDSYDSVFHENGELAQGPIALCEVQGYAYAAWRGAARLAEARNDGKGARQWRERAESLRRRFEDAFWQPDLGTYALALDGRKRPCRVRSSNPGHCLFTGIAEPERARAVADTLMASPSFAGWGIRTVAAGEARYNPMSYHNGSIWPHDTAMAAAGMARYGLTRAALEVVEGMFALSQAVDLHRLPELICGFHRRGDDEAPTLYPVACAPQAWASGAVYLLLGACLGMDIDAHARRVTFSRATLPASLGSVRLSNLIVGDATVDLLLDRHPNDVSVTVTRREGSVEIVSVK